MTKEKKNSGFGAVLQIFFASIKLTVVILVLLAATSIIGTLIPQNAEPSAYVNAYGEFVYRLLFVFDLFNMYYSWWFKTLIVLLAVNIIVCTLNRWPGTWKIISSQNLKFSLAGKKQSIAEFSDHREYGELDSDYRAYIKQKFKKFRVESLENGFRIIAEKGRWTRLGVPIVHLSIVFVLSGALLGSFVGFEGFVNIPEGGSVDRIRLMNGKSVKELGFEIRCDDFDVSFYETGAPKEYRSSLVILEKNQNVLEKDIIVNDPLRYKGINFFQSSYGSMPPNNVNLSFTNKDTGVSVQHNLTVGQSVELPDKGGKFTLGQYNQDYHFKNSELGEAVMGVLTKPGKASVEIALPFDFPLLIRCEKVNG
ncbi:cytochrome c biogenesis protein ResB [Desulfobacterales bacterium HSG17]|nr:cytochrome c biogenesis protein ResB [Desulfobacterales bacterium HSG17]